MRVRDRWRRGKSRVEHRGFKHMTHAGWDADRVQRLRIVAASVLVITSASVGIFVGRMSTWLVPTETPRSGSAARQMAAIDARERVSPPKATQSLEKPPAQPTPLAAMPRGAIAEQTPAGQELATAEPPKPLPLPGPPRQSGSNRHPATESGASAAPAPQSVDAGAESRRPQGNERGSTVASNPKPIESKVTLINPDGANAARDTSRSTPATSAGAQNPDAKAGGFEECERRYSSFRREDGTYQPYGGGVRVRCPHLR
jgi:BA14K-like protein